MRRVVKLWLHKLTAQVIGGGAAAVTSCFAASFVAPEAFNVNKLGNFAFLAGATFAVNGFLSMMMYLKQSPLPPLEEETETKNERPTNG